MQLATTLRTISIPTRTTIRRRKQRTAGVACARSRRISQVCWRNDVVQLRNLPRRLDVFDALDAGLRMQRLFTPAAKAGILPVHWDMDPARVMRLRFADSIRASSPSGLREQAGHMTAGDFCAARCIFSLPDG